VLYDRLGRSLRFSPWAARRSGSGAGGARRGGKIIAGVLRRRDFRGGGPPTLPLGRHRLRRRPDRSDRGGLVGVSFTLSSGPVLIPVNQNSAGRGKRPLIPSDRANILPLLHSPNGCEEQPVCSRRAGSGNRKRAADVRAERGGLASVAWRPPGSLRRSSSFQDPRPVSHGGDARAARFPRSARRPSEGRRRHGSSSACATEHAEASPGT